MNEAQPSNLSFYWEVGFLPQRCCAKKDKYVLEVFTNLWYTFFVLGACKTQLLT